jgi:hypothetical protein
VHIQVIGVYSWCKGVDYGNFVDIDIDGTAAGLAFGEGVRYVDLVVRAALRAFQFHGIILPKKINK